MFGESASLKASAHRRVSSIASNALYERHRIVVLRRPRPVPDRESSRPSKASDACLSLHRLRLTRRVWPHLSVLWANEIAKAIRPLPGTAQSADETYRSVDRQARSSASARPPACHPSPL